MADLSAIPIEQVPAAVRGAYRKDSDTSGLRENGLWSEYFNVDEVPQAEPSFPDPANSDEVYKIYTNAQSTIPLTDEPKVRRANAMPPLLQRLTERKPDTLDYLGVSYGLTPRLLRFWKRAGYIPLYLRQTQSGEILVEDLPTRYTNTNGPPH
ncbi:GNAT acetyltransferase 2-domain-containing protein [Cubamyces lactineus]|nr:GNAT acetyltransferase 2-domain-containing protein [Cubamyces lactineus]